LPYVADSAAIDKTKEYNFVDMYPIFPTIDLKEEQIYYNEDDLLKSNSPNIFNKNLINTIFHINDDEFSNEADISRLVMFAFGSAHAQSQINRVDLKNQIYF
jgi:hypothetical protein